MLSPSPVDVENFHRPITFNFVEEPPFHQKFSPNHSKNAKHLNTYFEIYNLGCIHSIESDINRIRGRSNLQTEKDYYGKKEKIIRMEPSSKAHEEIGCKHSCARRCRSTNH